MFATYRTPSHTALAGMLLTALLLTGCFTEVEDDGDMHPARVTVEMKLGASQSLSKSGESLAKTNLAGSRRMIVLMTSSKRDTVCDTITSQGSLLSQDPTFIGSNSDGQTVTARYDLAPHRKWNITVNVLDPRDSLWYAGSSTVEGLKAFDRRTVAMSLESRFAHYSAQFALPAAVSGRRVYFNRLTLSIDGVVVRDSGVQATAGSLGSAAFAAADIARLPGSAGNRFFKSVSDYSGGNITIAHEYVRSGNRQFMLSAYGYLEGDTVGVTPARLLFQGARSVTNALGKVSSEESVALDFKAAEVPEEGQGGVRMMVKIGKVGTLVMNVTTSGEIDF